MKGGAFSKSSLLQIRVASHLITMAGIVEWSTHMSGNVTKYGRQRIASEVKKYRAVWQYCIVTVLVWQSVWSGAAK